MSRFRGRGGAIGVMTLCAVVLALGSGVSGGALGANIPPVAVATCDVTSGPAPLTVNFDGSGSSDSDGTIIDYEWDIHGESDYGVTVTHTFATPGTYEVDLYVFDNDGVQGIKASLVVTVWASSGEIIVDNRDANTSRIGTWSASGGPNPWAGESLYCGDAAGRFTWMPEVAQAGTYQVYAWWTYHSNRSTSVPYRITHASGTDTVVVNQHDAALGGTWNLLGEYVLDAGSASYVEVSSESGQACADAVKLVLADVPPEDVIVDNRDANTSITGTWTVSSGPNPWETDSVYNNSNSTFRWIPEIAAAGSYDVYVWWTYHNNRSSAVPYTVAHAAGSDEVVVNQHDQSLGGQWNLLGAYAFDAGSAGYVEVSSSNGQASADAVRIVYSGGNHPPVALDQEVITEAETAVSITLAASDADGDTLTLAIHTQPSSGALTGFDTATGTVTYTPDSGFAGTDTFSFSANDGASDSNIATVSVVVNPSQSYEIIVDNLDANTSSTGTWTVSSGLNPWAGESRYSNSNSTFLWMPHVPEAGTYDVYAWWTYHGNRSLAVPYRVTHASATATIVVNQHDAALGGQWNLLGTYTFGVGSSGSVEVSSENGQACADAVMLVTAGAAPSAAAKVAAAPLSGAALAAVPESEDDIGDPLDDTPELGPSGGGGGGGACFIRAANFR